MKKIRVACFSACLLVVSSCTSPKADAEFSNLDSNELSGQQVDLNGGDSSETSSISPDDETANVPGLDLSAPREGVATESIALADPDKLGGFQMTCELSGEESFDLIQRAADYRVFYFGNTELSAKTTNGTEPETDLSNSSDSTCPGGRADLSAYWIPALLDSEGLTVKPRFFDISWNRSSLEPVTIQAPPNGLNVISGDPSGVVQPTSVAVWNCYNSGTEERRPGFGPQAISTIPDCVQGEELGLNVWFPQCWNGSDLSSPTNDHVAVPQRLSSPGETESGHTFQSECPDSHPTAIPRLLYRFSWDVDSPGGTQDWWLASDDLDGDDQPDVEGGATIYGGVMNSWDVETSKIWAENCVAIPSHCFGGNLNDGTRLKR